MSILARYLMREILASIGLALLALLGLFVLLDVIDEVRAVGPRYTVSLALLYVLLMLPSRMLEVLPAATIVGALFAFARLASRAEFTVMRASGLSVARLTSYMLGLGLALAAATHALGDYVVPMSERAAHQLKTRATTGVVAQQFQTGLWAKDGTSFINIQEMSTDASLRNMRVYVFDTDFRLTTIRQSEQAVWDADGAWRLLNTVETRISVEGTEVRHVPVMRWRSDLNPDLLALLMIPPERMSIQALRTYIEHLRSNKQRTARYELALWNKLSFTLAAPVMLLLALPFAYSPPRTSHWSGRVLIGLLIGLAFHLLNRLAGHIGLLNDWPPMLSALSALVLFGLAAALALWRVERG